MDIQHDELTEILGLRPDLPLKFLRDLLRRATDAVRATPGKRHIEQQFDLSSVHHGCFGTADAVIWDAKAKLLTVMDYKHGAGIPVNVTLLFYS